MDGASFGLASSTARGALTQYSRRKWMCIFFCVAKPRGHIPTIFIGAFSAALIARFVFARHYYESEAGLGKAVEESPPAGLDLCFGFLVLLNAAWKCVRYRWWQGCARPNQLASKEFRVFSLFWDFWK